MACFDRYVTWTLLNLLDTRAGDSTPLIEGLGCVRYDYFNMNPPSLYVYEFTI